MIWAGSTYDMGRQHTMIWAHSTLSDEQAAHCTGRNDVE